MTHCCVFTPELGAIFAQLANLSTLARIGDQGPRVHAAEWQYDGMLCGAESIAAGAMWECPLLLELQSIPDVARPVGLGPRGRTNLCHPEKVYKYVSSLRLSLTCHAWSLATSVWQQVDSESTALLFRNTEVAAWL